MAYKPPYLLLYVNDFLGSHYVDLMDSEQFGWYVKLLMRAWQWDTPCYLPNDMAVLRTILRVGRREREVNVFQERFKIVYERFSVTEDGKSIYHPKLVAQYEELVAKYGKLSEAGRKGGLSKASSDAGSDAQPSQKHPDLDPDLDSTPEPKKQKQCADALPHWIASDAELLESWNAFVEMRKKIKTPLTKRAVTLAIRDLEHITREGHDPKKVLDQSVMKCWRGLFPPSGSHNGTAKQTASQRNQQSTIEAARAVILGYQGVDCSGTGNNGDSVGQATERGTIEGVCRRVADSPAVQAPNRVQAAKAGVDS